LESVQLIDRKIALQGGAMGSAPTEPIGVGIDIAKDTFEVALGDGETFNLANDSSGQDALLTRLQEVTIGLIVLEATGRL
jgi:hypothetical protein